MNSEIFLAIGLSALLLVGSSISAGRPAANSINQTAQGPKVAVGSTFPLAGVYVMTSHGRHTVDGDPFALGYTVSTKSLATQAYGVITLRQLGAHPTATTIRLADYDVSYNGGLPDASVSGDGHLLALADPRGLNVYDLASKRQIAGLTASRLAQMVPDAVPDRPHFLRGVIWDSSNSRVAFTSSSKVEEETSGTSYPLAVVFDIRTKRAKKIGLGSPRAWLNDGILCEEPFLPGTTKAAEARLYSTDGRLMRKVSGVLAVPKSNSDPYLVKRAKGELILERWSGDLRSKEATSLLGKLLPHESDSSYVVIDGSPKS